MADAVDAERRAEQNRAARARRAPNADADQLQDKYRYLAGRRRWRGPELYRRDHGGGAVPVRVENARGRLRRRRLAERLGRPLVGRRLRFLQWRPRLALSRNPAKLRQQAVTDVAAASSRVAQGNTVDGRAKAKALFARGFEAAADAIRGGLIKGPRYRRLRLGDPREAAARAGNNSTYISAISFKMNQLREAGYFADEKRPKVRAQKILAEAGREARENREAGAGPWLHVQRVPKDRRTKDATFRLAGPRRPPGPPSPPPGDYPDPDHSEQYDQHDNAPVPVNHAPPPPPPVHHAPPPPFLGLPMRGGMRRGPPGGAFPPVGIRVPGGFRRPQREAFRGGRRRSAADVLPHNAQALGIPGRKRRRVLARLPNV